MSGPVPPRVAIALQYDKGYAPRVTAKGQGAVADRIIATAREHDIPIEEDPILAQALARIPLDDEIPEDLYRAVAEVIGFVLRAARARRG
jgi:flagellar biosynthesis protein